MHTMYLFVLIQVIKRAIGAIIENVKKSALSTVIEEEVTAYYK